MTELRQSEACIVSVMESGELIGTGSAKGMDRDAAATVAALIR